MGKTQADGKPKPFADEAMAAEGLEVVMVRRPAHNLAWPLPA